MPGMTAVEKAFARASGLACVAPGDIVHPQPARVFVHDGHVEGFRRQLDALGIDRIRHPERVVFATDHEVVYLTPRAAERGARIRETARDWKVGHFHDVGQGGHGHLFPMETGLVSPGMFVFASDMHCSNFGAIGAVPVRSGPETLSVLAMGTVWTVVPGSVRVELRGQPLAGTGGRDIGFRLAWALSRGPARIDVDYRYLEIAGPALEAFDLHDRVALCNSPTEIGVAGVYLQPSAALLRWCGERAQEPFAPLESDEDALYEHRFVLDVEGLGPQVALPGSPADVVDLPEVAGQVVQHAYIGSCGSGLYEDLARAAALLRGRRVAAGTRLFVVPGTVEVARRVMADGLVDVFLAAGAVVLPAGCGPCAGGHLGPMHSGEASISTAATNHAGRMGAKDARCFLASPATVAASAVTGRITDARELDGGVR